jgi:hypothetical protein
MSRHKVKIIATMEYVINTTAYGVETIDDGVAIDKASYDRGEVHLQELFDVGDAVTVRWEVGEELV